MITYLQLQSLFLLLFLYLTHWHLELFGKNAFLDILEIFSLDRSQISSKNGFKTWEHAFSFS